MRQINALLLNFDACPMNAFQNLSVHALDLSHAVAKFAVIILYSSVVIFVNVSHCREGVIKPMSVSPEGKLVPMDEFIAQTRLRAQREMESDDDDEDNSNDKINVKTESTRTEKS